jgi:hypothetical protein
MTEATQGGNPMKRLEIGLELPIQQLGLNNLVDFDFILAHLVLSHPAYRGFYVAQSEKGRKSMLDNGMWEHGGNPPLTFEDLCTVIGIIQPTEVIVPDVFMDAGKTFENATDWFKMQSWHPILSDCSYQLVVQGKNFNEAIESYKRLLEMSLTQNEKLKGTHERQPVLTIAFPLGVGCADLSKDTWAPMREAILANVALKHVYDPTIKIHLMSIQNPVEVSHFLKMNDIPIQSLDTGAPVRAAMAGLRYNEKDGSGERVDGVLNPDDELTHDQVQNLLHNIKVLRKFTGHGSS